MVARTLASISEVTRETVIFMNGFRRMEWRSFVTVTFVIMTDSRAMAKICFTRQDPRAGRLFFDL